MSAKKSKDGEEFSGYSEFYLADETYGEKEALEESYLDHGLGTIFRPLYSGRR